MTNDTYSHNIYLLYIEPVYHVHIPTQPSAESGEGIFKFNTHGTVSAISPATSQPMVELTLKDIRRIGIMVINNKDILWLETCKSCKKTSREIDQFVFFIVCSGNYACQNLLRELKITTERCTGVFLIMEETTSTEISYISRNHYGCTSFPIMARNRILYGGLSSPMSSPISPSPLVLGDVIRRPSEPVMNMGVTLEEIAVKPSRRGTISVSSPTNPYPPARPFLSRGPTSLDRFHKPSLSSLSSQASLELPEEVVHTPLSDAVFDTGSPLKRQLSHKDSLSSHGSASSTGSIPEDDDHSNSISATRRLSKSRPDLHRPNIPPRSPASLKLRSTTPSAL